MAAPFQHRQPVNDPKPDGSAVTGSAQTAQRKLTPMNAIRRSTAHRLALILLLPLALAGCGTAVGAGAGGVAGNVLTDGSTAGTVIGAVGGGVLGHVITGD